MSASKDRSDLARPDVMAPPCPGSLCSDAAVFVFCNVSERVELQCAYWTKTLSSTRTDLSQTVERAFFSLSLFPFSTDCYPILCLRCLIFTGLSRKRSWHRREVDGSLSPKLFIVLIFSLSLCSVTLSSALFICFAVNCSFLYSRYLTTHRIFVAFSS